MTSPQPPHNPPHWACWLAQDEDGSWWAFEAEPNEYDRGWYENEVGRCLKLGDGAPNPRWHESLQKLPNNSAYKIKPQYR